MSCQRAGERIAQLELEVAELMERDQQAQARETQETLDIPAELVKREKRVAALQAARQVIEERAREMAAAQQPPYEAKVAARKQQRDEGKKPRGKDPTPPSPTPDPKAQFHFTDPESRIMKAGCGPHFAQAYNASAAVAAISAVVAPEVAVLADSGFYSAAAVRAGEQNPDGPSTGMKVYAAVAKHSHPLRGRIASLNALRDTRARNG